MKPKGKKNDNKKADADARKKAKADNLAERKKLKEARAAERAAKKMPNQNGVTRPKPGTKCAAAWDIFDSISAKNRKPATIGEAMTLAKPKKLNDATVRTQYSRWRAFHGVKGRLESTNAKPKPAAKKKAKAKAAPKAKAKAKAKTSKPKAKAKAAAPASVADTPPETVAATPAASETPTA